MEVFWKSIAAYNEATWIWQLCFIIAAAVLTCFLWFRPGKRIVLAVKALMVAESLWIAFVYYLDFCSTRDYSGVLTIFWCMVAAAWVYDMVTKFSTFEKSGKYRWWGLVMLLLPLLYPVISLLRGMTFPEMATPMLPSGVALYMLGMLMTFNSKINFFAFIFILHWAIISISKIVIFNIPEDALLAIACLPAMYIFLSDAVDRTPSPSKPSAKAVKILVFTITVLIGATMVIAYV